VALEDGAEAVAVVDDQRPHHLVGRIVEREAARGTGEGQQRRSGGHGVRAAGDVPLFLELRVLGLRVGRRRGGLVRGHQY
jgi:hypothetical protein